MPSGPRLVLANGYMIPALGLGTHNIYGEDAEQATTDAINCGYHLIDTSFLCGNQKSVGQALEKGVEHQITRRGRMFIVGKLSNNFHEPHQVEVGCRLSLREIKAEYFDLFLLQSPVSVPYLADTAFSPEDEEGNKLFDDSIDLIDTWRAMEALIPLGLTRMIGVSNFNFEQLKYLLSNCWIPPVVNQVECSPRFRQSGLIKYCQKRDVKILAYEPLGRVDTSSKTPSFLFDAKVMEIAKKHDKTPAQIILRYMYEIGTVPIVTSTNKDHIEENIDIFTFELFDEDRQYLDTLNTGKRQMTMPGYESSAKYPFNDRVYKVDDDDEEADD